MDGLVFAVIDRLLANEKRVLVAIDGPCGSGKSSLALRLQAVYDCPVISMDHFFLRPWQRTKSRLAEPGGNVDYMRFFSEVILPFKEDKPFYYEIYECQADSMYLSEKINPHPLTIVEGSYSLHPYLAEHYDLKVFVKINRSEEKRILKRNGPVMLERFLQEWIPLENRYFNHFEVEKQCDLVICGDKLVSFGNSGKEE